MKNVLLVGLVLVASAGCRSEEARLRAEVARLTEENQALRMARLQEENDKLRAEVRRLADAASQQRDDDDDEQCGCADEGASDDSSGPKSDAEIGEWVLQQAKDAYVHGHYTSAIAAARGALETQPNQANRLIGASYCFLKDRNGASSVYRKLDPQGQQFLKYVCSRNNITIGR
jgi:hypothetical protein